MPRLPFWNPADDCSIMNHACFRIDKPDGYVHIHACERKPDKQNPDYPCGANLLHNAFAATLFLKDKIIHITNGFVPITEDNLISYLAQYS